MRETYWETIPYTDWSPEEWDALCDGCGWCCLHKFETDSGAILYSAAACPLLDLQTCQCSDYPRRLERMDDCVKLSPETLRESVRWLPESCAYRRVYYKQPLHPWHHLLCGDRERVHDEGHSALSQAQSDNDIEPDEWHQHVARVVYAVADM